MRFWVYLGESLESYFGGRGEVEGRFLIFLGIVFVRIYR